MNSVSSNSLSLEYQRFTQSVYKDIGNRKLESVAKTQFRINSNHLIFELNVDIFMNLCPGSKYKYPAGEHKLLGFQTQHIYSQTGFGFVDYSHPLEIEESMGLSP